MALNDTLMQMKAASLAKIPPEAAATMAQVLDDFKAAGVVENALKAGQKAPNFNLQDYQGHRYNSTDLLGKGPLLLCFYRGSW